MSCLCYGLFLTHTFELSGTQELGSGPMPKAPSEIISHWSTMIQGLDTQPKDFYEHVKLRIASKEIDKVKFHDVYWHEGGVTSPKRLYLRVRRKDLMFDICGAPFGNGFFVSWWLGEIRSGFWGLITSIPILGTLIEVFLKPITYYRLDTASMFQSLVHAAVMEAIDKRTSAKGLRALTDDERKPIMRDFFKRS